MRKTFEQIGEYDCLMAEVLRRNPEYAQEARAIKNKLEHHVAGPHLSDEYVAFCEKWNLNIHPASFLDPDDLSNPIRRNPFKKSPSGDVKRVVIEFYDKKENKTYRLKANPDKVYLEIDPFIPKEVLATKIERLIGYLRTGERKRIDAIKFDIKVWDLLATDKDIKTTALKLKEKPSTIAKAAIRAYGRIAGKPFTKNVYKKEGLAEPGVCATCKDRNTCTELCRKTEKYANQDHVASAEPLGKYSQ